eukprot:Opistho-2@80448
MTGQSKCCPSQVDIGASGLSPEMYASALAFYRSVPCSAHGHPWNADHRTMYFDLWLKAFLAAFKLYAPLFFIPALLYQRKGLSSLALRTLPDTGRSAAFIATFATSFCLYFCVFRNLLGANYVPTNGFVPGFLASFSSLLIERKNRRAELALYCANHAASAVVNMLVSRGLVRRRQHMDGVIVASSLATLLYFHAKKPDHIGSGAGGLLTFLFGKEEQLTSTDNAGAKEGHAAPGGVDKGKRAEGSEGAAEAPLSTGTETPHVPGVPHTADDKRKKSRGNALVALLSARFLQLVPRDIKDTLSAEQPRHTTCPHRRNCLAYALAGLARSFGFGFAAKFTVALISGLVRGRPRKAVADAFGKKNLLTGAFLGVMVGGYRALVCGMRHVTGCERGRHHAIAGFVVGWATLLAPNHELSMWLVSKACEAAYYGAAEKGTVRRHYYGDLLLFSVACSILFHASMFEPHNVRKSYWEFLMSASTGRFSLLKRDHLDFLGYDSYRLARETAAAKAKRA